MDHAADGQTGLRMAMTGNYDVIILDIGLPRLDGLLLCRRLREAGNGVAVIMLTARDQLDDKIKGFAEGADDYLVKPFEMRELDARIGVLARLRHPSTDGIIRVGGLELNPAGHLARREGKAIPLTRSQTRSLQCLMLESPRVVSREKLIHATWGEEGAEASALHTHIYTLRGLVDKPFSERLVHTIHGIGYCFRSDA